MDYRTDQLALAVILRAVPLEMLQSLAMKTMVKEVWEAMKVMRQGVQRVREANTQKL